MSAEVIDIHGYLSVCPPERHDDPCPVVVLPVVRIERTPDGRKPQERDYPPCDVEG